MTDENDIIATRREKQRRWRDRGLAYPNAFRRTATARELHEAHGETGKPELEDAAIETAVSGRVMLRRVMGKASFVTLQDGSGRIQCYLRRDDIGEDAYGDFVDLWDIGDIVGIEGTLMRTNKGELTVAARKIELLSKTVRPLPEKYHGLADQELRYRRRYLDLLMNEDSRRVFELRSAAISAVRRFFEERGFIEVETPMMHVIPGGATARPFVTHHNTLDLDLYLRVAPELFLKRLVVGGFEGVFEINRNFRNEGLSTRHNPEFTMLEFYWAYHDFEDLMQLTEALLGEVARAVLGTTVAEYRGRKIDFGKPVERLSMVDAIERHTDLSRTDLQDAQRMTSALTAMNRPVEDHWGLGKLQLEIFEARVEDQLVDPTFITHYPRRYHLSRVATTPTRRSRTDSSFSWAVGRLPTDSREINDPDDQAARFRAQVEAKASGDDEAMGYDDDYVTALEYVYRRPPVKVSASTGW